PFHPTLSSSFFTLSLHDALPIFLFKAAALAALRLAKPLVASLQNASAGAESYLACSGLRPRSKGLCPCRAALGSPHSPPWGSGRGGRAAPLNPHPEPSPGAFP